MTLKDLINIGQLLFTLIRNLGKKLYAITYN